MRWNGWGDPARATALPGPILDLLRQVLGAATTPPAPAVPLADVQLPEVHIEPEHLARLAGIVGSDYVRSDAESRLRCTRGKSTVDLLRMRLGDASDAPDAVVAPGTHDEVVAVLAACSDHRIAVVPFGGGTSVVGGLVASRIGFAAVIALDLGRMNALAVLDPVSLTAEFQAGVRGPEAEAALAGHGLTLGHYPQSFEYASIGGFAATRSSGQFSFGYGRFDEMVVAMRVATPTGTIELGRAQRSAAGPDLRQLFLGSEGTLGVITSVTVQVQPAPTETLLESWRFDDFTTGLAAARELAQAGLRPTMVRISDEPETGTTALVEGRAPGGGCQAIVGYAHAQALRDREAITACLQRHGAERGDDAAAQGFLGSRFRAPYLRDALLDAGILVETVETAGFWSRVPDLYQRVRGALETELTRLGTPPLVLCHMSHVYHTGAALYFTVVGAAAPDPIEQWLCAKTAANRAIEAAGGSITHHHAVGRDHAAGLLDEVGPLALDGLRAIKARLDPAGVLNPGVLLGTAS